MPTTAASYDGTWCLLQNLCAHSTDGTRRRVHSPSWATSSRVTSLTAVRGSTNPSTPRRAVTNFREVLLVGSVGGAHGGRPGARGVAGRSAHPRARLRRKRSNKPMGPSVPTHRQSVQNAVAGCVSEAQKALVGRCGQVRKECKDGATSPGRKDRRGRRRLRRTHSRGGLRRLRLCAPRGPARPHGRAGREGQPGRHLPPRRLHPHQGAAARGRGRRPDARVRAVRRQGHPRGHRHGRRRTPTRTASSPGSSRA